MRCIFDTSASYEAAVEAIAVDRELRAREDGPSFSRGRRQRRFVTAEVVAAVAFQEIDIRDKIEIEMCRRAIPANMDDQMRRIPQL